MNIENYNKNAVSANLKDFDYLAKDTSHIEITEWNNGEGYDISIDEKLFSLSLGELEAINFLIKYLEHSK